MDTESTHAGQWGAWRALPVAVAVALVVPLAWRGRGSIDIGEWLQYGVALALVLAAAFASGTALRPRRAAVVSVGALLAFALWTGVTATWSPLPTLGRDDALLALTYALALALPALTLRSPASRTAAVTVVVLVLGAAAALVGVALLWWADPGEAFRGGRLYYPLSYVNAQAAFCLIGFWPAVVIASRRSGPLLVRAAATGAGAAMLGGWLITQSRGAAVALFASGVALLALCPARLRLLVPMLVAAVPVAAFFGTLTGAFGIWQPELVVAPAQEAARAQLVAAGIAAVAGLVYALADRRVAVPATARRVAGWAVLALVVAGVVGGATAFVAAKGSPVAYVSSRWDEFTTHPERETGSTHFESLGTNRYDFWVVAGHDFVDHPLGGIGARGFAAAYLIRGESGETPQRSHSLAMDVLSETGLVGFLLLLVALGAPLLHAARRLDRVPASAAFGGAAFWLAHAAVDWTWSFPAVGIPAMLLLGIPLASGRAAPLPGRLSAVGAVAALAAGLLVLAPPWLASRFAQAAVEGRPADAPARLEWAQRLDPFSVQPDLAEAAVAPSREAALPALERAARREPRNVEVVLRLGLAYRDAGRREAARETLRDALALHPRSVLIRRLVRRSE